MSDFEEGKLIEVSSIAESRTVAMLNKSEIEQQIDTAHKYPRSIKRFHDEGLAMVTLSEGIARECVYALPRDGKVIEGPSARFAEIIAHAWGNNRAGARVIDDSGDFVTSQGFFLDLEKNSAVAYEVQRRIVDKNGKRYKPDMIGVTANAASSIALRNAILKGVPKAFWTVLFQRARQTIMGDFKTLANRRADAMKEFVAYGVNEAMLFEKLGVAGMADIGMEHLVVLAGLLTALKDGDTTVEDAFSKNEGAKVQGPRDKSEPAPQATANAPLDHSAPKADSEAKPAGSGAKAPTLADCKAMLADGPDGIAIARDWRAGLSPEDQAELDRAIEAQSKPEPKNDNGDRLLTAGEAKHIGSKLLEAGLTLTDLQAKFGVTDVAFLRLSQFAAVKNFAKSRPAD